MTSDLGLLPLLTTLMPLPANVERQSELKLPKNYIPIHSTRPTEIPMAVKQWIEAGAVAAKLKKAFRMPDI